MCLFRRSCNNSQTKFSAKKIAHNKISFLRKGGKICILWVYFFLRLKWIYGFQLNMITVAVKMEMGFVRFNFVFLISFFFPVNRIPCRAPSAKVSRGPWHAWTSRGAAPSPLGCRTAPQPSLPKAPRLSSTSSASQASRPPWGTPRAPQAPSSRAPPRASASQQSSKTGAPPTLGLSPPRLSTQPSNQQLLDYWCIVIKLFCVISRVCSMSHTRDIVPSSLILFSPKRKNQPYDGSMCLSVMAIVAWVTVCINVRSTNKGIRMLKDTR